MSGAAEGDAHLQDAAQLVVVGDEQLEDMRVQVQYHLLERVLDPLAGIGHAVSSTCAIQGKASASMMYKEKVIGSCRGDCRIQPLSES